MVRTQRRMGKGNKGPIETIQVSLALPAKEKKKPQLIGGTCSLRTDHEYIKGELQEMAEQLDMERRLVGEATWWTLLKEMWTITGNRKRTLISIGLMVCQQMTGTNTLVCKDLSPGSSVCHRRSRTDWYQPTELLCSTDIFGHGTYRAECRALRDRGLRVGEDAFVPLLSPLRGRQSRSPQEPTHL